jgi:hypothetical protein
MSANLQLVVLPLLTSTSSNIATTRTSSPEFLHPTIIPGESDLGISRGQNILIRPSCSGMTDFRRLVLPQKEPRRRSCSRADIPALPDLGCCKCISHILHPILCFRTRVVSPAASLSNGIMNKKKNTERMANPFAVRVYAMIIRNCLKTMGS